MEGVKGEGILSAAMRTLNSFKLHQQWSIKIQMNEAIV